VKEIDMLRVATSRVILFFTGLTLLMAALLMSLAGPVVAAPHMLITETPPIEPPTRTSVPADTPTSVSIPTSTPLPAPPPASGGGGDEQPEDTPTPTETPSPTSTPVVQIQIADPSITKVANVATAQVGDTVTFSIIVTNQGNATASDVVVEDSLPGFLSLNGVNATRGVVNVSGATIRVTIGDLAPGEVVTITVTAQITASAEPPNNTNVATVSTSSSTDNPANNSGSVGLIISQPPKRMPNTSDQNNLLLPALLVLGLGLIGASLFTRRRQA